MGGGSHTRARRRENLSRLVAYMCTYPCGMCQTKSYIQTAGVRFHDFHDFHSAFSFSLSSQVSWGVKVFRGLFMVFVGFHGFRGCSWFSWVFMVFVVFMIFVIFVFFRENLLKVSCVFVFVVFTRFHGQSTVFHVQMHAFSRITGLNGSAGRLANAVDGHTDMKHTWFV